jgi:hypothetical protein
MQRAVSISNHNGRIWPGPGRANFEPDRYHEASVSHDLHQRALFGEVIFTKDHADEVQPALPKGFTRHRRSL